MNVHPLIGFTACTPVQVWRGIAAAAAVRRAGRCVIEQGMEMGMRRLKGAYIDHAGQGPQAGAGMGVGLA
eukprot:scaffold10274_cov106-Isochrysis_galbana.AAC.6